MGGISPREPGCQVTSTGDDRQLLLAEISGSAVALPLAAVREVVPMAALTRVPTGPALLEGFLNLGGELVPVLRTDHLLSLRESRPTPGSRIVVLAGGGALLFDAVHGVGTGTALHPLRPEDSFNGAAEGLLEVGEAAYHLLRPERLLLEAERRRLEELAEVERQRLSAVGAAG
jgi:purine-binding chemotaxis protein CheW